MFGLGTIELIVIGAIVFLIFGAKRLPEIGKGMGGAIREFRKVKKELGSKDDEGQEQKAPTAIEDKLAEKVAEQVPGVKEAMGVKKKVEKVKDIINS